MVRGNSIHSLESSFVERALMPKGALIRPILVATSAVARANGRIAKKASKEFLHSFCWASEKGTSYFLSYLWMGKMIGIKWSKWSSTLLFYGGCLRRKGSWLAFCPMPVHACRDRFESETDLSVTCMACVELVSVSSCAQGNQGLLAITWYVEFPRGLSFFSPQVHDYLWILNCLS